MVLLLTVPRLSDSSDRFLQLTTSYKLGVMIMIICIMALSCVLLYTKLFFVTLHRASASNNGGLNGASGGSTILASLRRRSCGCFVSWDQYRYWREKPTTTVDAELVVSRWSIYMRFANSFLRQACCFLWLYIECVMILIRRQPSAGVPKSAVLSCHCFLVCFYAILSCLLVAPPPRRFI